MLDRRALIALVFASVSLAFGCATDQRGQGDYYDDGYDRNGRYYGNPYPVPYGHGQGYESPLERHQEREKRAVSQEQQAEDRDLRHEQKDERKELKQADQWGKDDRQRQREEKRALEHEQKDERKDLRKHQKREDEAYRDWD
jgi:hypothetical protein